ncbi:peptide chain release factor 2 [Polycladomyces subterraneus]|uniref:Peptide chain release factor 2 n=1 Tax=Polycladomyces subterraneus TaxID=1016997 RepID=A0ABT8IIU7_9BACL|nr:peptide chain release factor 2 [Polycladomyces subterraneus]MDN4592718.1 peptide chain release factor 2 [Polycladomyces subterraneus]
MSLGELKQEVTNTAKRLADIRGSLDLDQKKARIAELEAQMTAPDFWDDQQQAQKVIDEANGLKAQVETMTKLEQAHEDLQVLLELAAEEDDESLLEEAEETIRSLKKEMTQFELSLLLSEPYDKNNAILELHPGAGGTESQDWASMLLRMYTRWAERRGYKVETLDYLPGEEAGIKSVTLLIKGHNAYGYLKAEKGVHRLVRISPFDASGRRHTSFVSANVMPEVDDDVEVEIKPEELKIDTYRSSGAGGQHVNTTDSAVRITHLPTGIVVTCQSERSQIKNRERAMKILKARLYERMMEERRKQIDQLKGEQTEIGWGNQIRSYVFHPYSLVKDHRTQVEVGNVQAVMDGEIDVFIDAYLRQKIGGQQPKK